MLHFLNCWIVLRFVCGLLRHTRSVFTFFVKTSYCSGLVVNIRNNLMDFIVSASKAHNYLLKMNTWDFTWLTQKIFYIKRVANYDLYLQAQLDYESVCRRRRHLHQETTSPLVTETNRDRGDKLVIDKNCNATLAATQASNQPLDTNTQLLQGESLCPGRSSKKEHMLKFSQFTPSCK
jgi:hypothetical protein